MTIFVKQFNIPLALKQKSPKIDAKSTGISAKMYKKRTKPCYICKLATTKIGNLVLKINMQYARWAKLGRMTGKLSKLDYRMGLSNWEGRNALQ